MICCMDAKFAEKYKKWKSIKTQKYLSCLNVLNSPNTLVKGMSKYIAIFRYLNNWQLSMVAFTKTQLDNHVM